MWYKGRYDGNKYGKLGKTTKFKSKKRAGHQTVKPPQGFPLIPAFLFGI
jgi:hypothetical protein